jgi:hypothetical protein
VLLLSQAELQLYLVPHLHLCPTTYDTKHDANTEDDSAHNQAGDDTWILLWIVAFPIVVRVVHRRSRSVEPSLQRGDVDKSDMVTVYEFDLRINC